MDGTCKFNASNVGATIKSWTDVASGSEPDLQKVALNNYLHLKVLHTSKGVWKLYHILEHWSHHDIFRQLQPWDL